MENRRGFTLMELMIVATLGSVLVLSAYTVLVTTLRAYTVVGSRVQSQQTVRAGLEVLFAELREVSPSGGDVLAMGPDWVTLRSMTSFGLVCAVTMSGTPRVTVRRDGNVIAPQDSVFILADNDVNKASDDVWLVDRVGTVDTLATCPSGDAAQEISLPGLGTAMTVDSVRMGAPVRSYTHEWYGLQEWEGEWYLAWRGPSGSAEPLVGPLRTRSEGGLRFEYLDSSGSSTTTAADVAQFVVTLKAAWGATTPQGTPVSDSVVSRVYPRN